MILLDPSPTDMWQLALDDARLREEDIALFLFDDAGSRFPPAAMTVEPGLCACEVAGDEFPFEPGTGAG
jgi:hypothetical protein